MSFLLQPLPNEIFLHCLNFLQFEDLKNASGVNKGWWNAVLKTEFCKKIALRHGTALHPLTNYLICELPTISCFTNFRVENKKMGNVASIVEVGLDCFLMCRETVQKKIYLEKYDLKGLLNNFFVRAHEKELTGLKIRCDKIYTTSLDGTLKIWDLKKGTLLRAHRETSPITALHLSHFHIFWGMNDGRVKCQNKALQIKEWKLTNSISWLFDTTESCYAASTDQILFFSNIIAKIVSLEAEILMIRHTSENYLALCKDKKIRGWNRITFKESLTLEIKEIPSVSASSLGEQLIFGANKAIEVFEFAHGVIGPLTSLCDSSLSVMEVVKETLIMGFFDKGIRFFDLKSKLFSHNVCIPNHVVFIKPWIGGLIVGARSPHAPSQISVHLFSFRKEEEKQSMPV